MSIGIQISKLIVENYGGGGGGGGKMIAGSMARVWIDRMSIECLIFCCTDLGFALCLLKGRILCFVQDWYLY